MTPPPDIAQALSTEDVSVISLAARTTPSRLLLRYSHEIVAKHALAGISSRFPIGCSATLLGFAGKSFAFPTNEGGDKCVPVTLVPLRHSHFTDGEDASAYPRP